LTKQAKPRGHRRRPLAVAASLRTGSGHAREAELSDLSEAGCKLRLDAAPLDPEQRVVIRPGQIEGLSGVVRWSDGASAGIAFDGQLHPAIVDHLAGEGEVLGCPPAPRRAGSTFTDRFGRALPTLGGSRRKP
jgi:hypothetical protein